MLRKRILPLMVLLLCSSIVLKASEDQTVVSKYKIKVYGFLKLDATLDDSKTNNPDAPKYASLEAATDDESQFAMTAMNSRIGFKYYGPENDNVSVFGNVELDFYDTASDNSQKPRMRHAYFMLKFASCELLAGQTWDIFGPLGSSSLNTNGWLWYAGNVGFRRPQIRLTKHHKLGENSKITKQISINRNIGITNGVGAGAVNTGENSGCPLAEGRIAYSFSTFGKFSTIGIAGLYGVEKYNRNNGVDESSYDVPESAVGLDASIVLGAKLSFKGELFQGTNIDSLLAGLGQGINTTTEDGIATTGGWAQITVKTCCNGSLNLGYGAEELDKDDLNSGNRLKNAIIFANIICYVNDDVKIGAEYANFQTDYIDTGKGENNRVTTSFIYSF